MNFYKQVQISNVITLLLINKFMEYSFNSTIDRLSDCIFCFYTNMNDRIQVIKITNIPNYYWEKTIFPRQRLIFEGTSSAFLEVYNSDDTVNPSNIIHCQKLQITE